ncbi:hypothetical protein A2331_01225 [Candidatus Falkowbacteria bacterium RIFOXYB2_FULL_34_18]|uniref:Uncharacterized protein n=1 Tax=Candidatus Falkowbacteria bacterium RIFOXYD2_FULL_34_120 TaxID=1798007 RepID=A0A1F5TPF5_9BACT|nr:MAG: hypothetical protein A2331_01225 [Candidatus Falkowbacteria bacterium RIFOXYB2_FULL_34_18]OGF29136.1 MAG: hypothetical protein A2500_02835 [Candidatus Falkowbacteria bacterium RIFOXYC12_FULL_34_55]OGF36232.1 MAG: hypothetical protein A2466_05005 [Candidatus Falkowbacteria bacterium RIFOXYC2_FULL_34_220]OGF38646.1 MAG: hypothetical protein A2515_06965 [Candidatus Falkowbacteria bacterium RIFOXYD12_FULL_34_57]OGF40835.1 MAG: hypothetical protein A2531_06670 [Candidatus Falkowbacteria bact
MNPNLKEKILEYLKITAEAAGFGEPKSIAEIIGGLIGVFLSLLGIIFLVLIIYGGFIWMTSAGNETKVLKAKKILTNAVIGLIIVISSYAITAFIMASLYEASH